MPAHTSGHICLEDLYCNKGDPQLDDADKFSPIAGCTATSAIMKATQQRGNFQSSSSLIFLYWLPDFVLNIFLETFKVVLLL